MPYVTSAGRIGIRKGIQQGSATERKRLRMVRRRFGAEVSRKWINPGGHCFETAGFLSLPKWASIQSVSSQSGGVESPTMAEYLLHGQSCGSLAMLARTGMIVVIHEAPSMTTPKKAGADPCKMFGKGFRAGFRGKPV